MEKQKIYLTKDEQQFKSYYQKGDKTIFEKPLSFYEYEQLDDKLKLYNLSIERFHRTANMGSTGNTVRDISQDGNYIDSVRHSRYSYPLMHNHEYIEIVYVYSGTCKHFIEEQIMEMHAGDLCILSPNALHAISAVEDDALIINIMMSQAIFDSGFLKVIKGDFILGDFLRNVLYNRKVSPYILFPTGDDIWLAQNIMNVLTESEKKVYLYKENMTLLVKQIFIYLIRNYQMYAIVSNPIENTQDSNIIAVMGYISVNYSHISLKELAQFFGYNETYLGKIIQNYTGKTFSVLLSEVQMKNASRLLEESTLSITEIGCEVGCYDASHFNRKFKKQYGVTPAQYRKDHRVH